MIKAVVPVAVKLSPYFSFTGEMALRLDRAGADGLVLFSRFLQPDIDPETLTVTAGFGLSRPAEARLPRAWIALLAGRVRSLLAATKGRRGSGRRGQLHARGDDRVSADPARPRARCSTDCRTG
jgi:dihydroorotate dehydrogenase (fumarate)